MSFEYCIKKEFVMNSMLSVAFPLSINYEHYEITYSAKLAQLTIRHCRHLSDHAHHQARAQRLQIDRVDGALHVARHKHLARPLVQRQPVDVHAQQPRLTDHRLAPERAVLQLDQRIADADQQTFRLVQCTAMGLIQVERPADRAGAAVRRVRCVGCCWCTTAVC